MKSDPKNYWLVKSEGDCYSIDDFARDYKRCGSIGPAGRAAQR